MLPLAPMIQGVGEPGTGVFESVVLVPLVHLSKILPVVVVLTPVRRRESPAFSPAMSPVPPAAIGPTVPVALGDPVQVVLLSYLAQVTVMFAAPSATDR